MRSEKIVGVESLDGHFNEYKCSLTVEYTEPENEPNLHDHLERVRVKVLGGGRGSDFTAISGIYYMKSRKAEPLALQFSEAQKDIRGEDHARDYATGLLERCAEDAIQNSPHLDINR